MKGWFHRARHHGPPMAGHLAGRRARAVPLTAPAAQRADSSKGGIACSSGQEVAQKADVVITMVPDTPHVEDVLFGPERRRRRPLVRQDRGRHELDLAGRDQGVRASGSTTLGCDYLDAPVSGGEVGAKAASLTIMVGGPQAAFDKVKPLFELMGKNITLVGEQRRRADRPRSPTRSSSR